MRKAPDHKSITVCYLCGEPLTPPISFDHVPMQQLYAPEIRRTHQLHLITLPVHDACNKAYQLDEDYFVHSLMPFGLGSVAGDAIYKEVLSKFRNKKKVGLSLKVLKEFDPQPSGLILPGGKVVKRFQGDRLKRVIWKIVRGLFFIHNGKVLPADAVVNVSVTAPGETPPEHFLQFMQLPDRGEHGQYPGVFAYRFDTLSDGAIIHYWAILLWDRLILTAIFHDPDCNCTDCEKDNRA